ncbi:MAG: PIN domain-containing protein [Candidatus Micrarchaeota archaeon]
MDSYAWIEYFGGTPLGNKVSKILGQNAIVVTPSVALTEIESFAIRHGKDTSMQFQAIKSRTAIIPISAQIARMAAELKVAHGLFTVDAIIYACAQQTGAVLLTEDEKLLALKGVKSLRQL